MNASSLSALSLSATLVGCGLQASAGPAWVGKRDVAPLTSLSIGTHAQRRSGPAFGARLSARPEDAGLTLKNGALHGGYDFIVIPGWLAIEPGVDFGAGQPATHVYEGTGAYGGGGVVTRVRLTPGDREPSFNIAFPIFELIAGGHLGVWMPPEGSTSTSVYVERTLELGIRIAVGSDLISPNQGGIWRGSAEDHQVR